MDGGNFDDIVRSLATTKSRRGVLRGGLALITGAIGIRMTGEAEAAAKPRKSGQVCRSNGDCASGRCGEPDRTGRGRCLCGSTADCPQSTTVCKTTTCSVDGVCGFAANVGAPCDTGNPCTTGDACNAQGRCAGTRIVCAAPDQCHDAGICDKQSGTCTNPPKANGTSCNDGNRCTTNDTCQAGICTGTPVVCDPARECLTPGICNPATGGCEYSFVANGTACDDGDACTTGDTCLNGSCQPGTQIECPICQTCVNGACSTGFGAVPTIDTRCSQSGPGRACCGGSCVSTFDDDSNCGSCGATCIGNSSCVNGICSGADCITPLSCVVSGGNPF